MIMNISNLSLYPYTYVVMLYNIIRCLQIWFEAAEISGGARGSERFTHAHKIIWRACARKRGKLEEEGVFISEMPIFAAAFILSRQSSQQLIGYDSARRAFPTLCCYPSLLTIMYLQVREILQMNI